ncbi:MAG: hypothetical protein DMG30_16290 [Acidobacteria bacterium]|nr:MAG: hypothetical protein DMG30_16290 [Acidobacteriota bacterium]
MADSLLVATCHWILYRWDAKIRFRGFFRMSPCGAPGCKMTVPAALEAEKLCILHFTLEIERRCAEMRRETAVGRTPRERQVEIINYVGGRGELLARTATSGLHLPDEMKARILNTFLTLMNLRENLDRAALRHPIGRTEGR